MDRERLFRHLEQRYTSKREMISRIPLGAQPESLWQELLSRRRAKSTVLPICNAVGMPFWYVTTDKMVSASEKVVEMLLENEQEFDPYTEAPNVVTLEEAFYTGYVDGAGITMQEAMEFLQSGAPPRDVEEQLIINNRQAGAYATKYLYRPVDEMYLQELATILTDGLDDGGGTYRAEDWIQIPSMMDEPYTLPSARAVPDRAAELVRMLDDSKLHPLIKSAAAQAWALVIRPFSEGNERLGRILSSVILLRSGYTFFSELSLSALIAQKSFGYYEAIANILREENGGDLTYFMEYYMDLLSRAVEEHQRRVVQTVEDHHEAEIQLAHTPLSKPEQQEEIESTLEPEQMVIPDEPAEPPPEPEARPTISIDKAKSILRAIHREWKNAKGDAAYRMISYLNKKKYEFSTVDLEADFGIEGSDRASLLKRLRKEGVADIVRRGQRCYIYRFCIDENEAIKEPVHDEIPEEELDLQGFFSQSPLLKESDYSPEILERIRLLRTSNVSPRDRRIGGILTHCLPRGTVTFGAYDDETVNNRWNEDMQLVEQMGIVEKVNEKEYRILRDVRPGLPSLVKSQKNMLTKLFRLFGTEAFSKEMVVATLEYSKPHACAILHQFTLIRIMEKKPETRDGSPVYQLLVNPDDHPECFNGAA